MRVRTGIGPNDWADLGPAAVAQRPQRYFQGAATIGSFVVPPSAGNIPVTQGELERRRKRLERTRKELQGITGRRDHPSCGRAMRYDELCGRRPGHAGSHRSRTVMDSDIERRRAS